MIRTAWTYTDVDGITWAEFPQDADSAGLVIFEPYKAKGADIGKIREITCDAKIKLYRNSVDNSWEYTYVDILGLIPPDTFVAIANRIQTHWMAKRKWPDPWKGVKEYKHEGVRTKKGNKKLAKKNTP